MISLLVVNFRSVALAETAVRTAREASSQPLQVVIVDNSCDPEEADALRRIADQVVVADRNLGYAGGINLGRPSCDSDTIVIANADLIFAPRSIDRLVEALDERTAVAGPALFWDDAHQWHLPPGDLMTAPQKIDQILATRSSEWRAQRDVRRFRQRVAFWSLQQTSPVRMLSGAIMAVRARDFDDVRGFDERFPLYFEETDFLRRIAERRKRIAYVPSSRVRHIYNQSASLTGLAAAHYAESEWKYLEKWNGPWLARALKRLERDLPSVILSASEGTPAASNIITEASPLASFDTAAGFLGHATDVPQEIRASLKDGELYLRHVDRDTARVLATYKISP